MTDALAQCVACAPARSQARSSSLAWAVLVTLYAGCSAGIQQARSAITAWRQCTTGAHRVCKSSLFARPAGLPAIFAHCVRCHCRGAAAAVVVYDISNADSFAKAKSWVKELPRQGNPAMIMALAGNKADLTELRAVQTEEAKARAPAWQLTLAFVRHHIGLLALVAAKAL